MFRIAKIPKNSMQNLRIPLKKSCLQKDNFFPLNSNKVNRFPIISLFLVRLVLYYQYFIIFLTSANIFVSLSAVVFPLLCEIQTAERVLPLEIRYADKELVIFCWWLSSFYSFKRLENGLRNRPSWTGSFAWDRCPISSFPCHNQDKVQSLFITEVIEWFWEESRILSCFQSATWKSSNY